MLLPKSVEPTSGLKDSSVKLLSAKSLSERTPQAIEVQAKLGGDQRSLQPRLDLASSLDSAVGEGDNLSNNSGNSDNRYDPVRFERSEFIDDENRYMTVAEVNQNPSTPNSDLIDEDQYEFVDNINFDDAQDTSEVNEEITETVGNNARDERDISETNLDGSNSGDGSDQVFQRLSGKGS